MAWPFLLVLFYFLTDFGRPQDWFHPLSALKPGMLALGGGIVAILVRRHEVLFPTRAKLVILFIGLMCLGTPFATNGHFAYVSTKDFALFFFGAVIPLMTFVNTYARMEKLVGLILLIHIPLALFSITHKGVGIGSFLGDENDFCLALNVILPYAFFSLYFVPGARRKIVTVLTLGLLLFAITATGSRGGFLGLVAAAGYCWLASPRKILSLVILAAISLPVLAVVPDSYWKEVKSIETATDEDDTGAQRLYLWNMGWEMFKDHPIVGVGPTNYQWNSFKYESANQQDRGVNVWGKGSHSLYFTLLPEYGVAGVTVFVAILVLCFRDNYRIRRACRALTASGTSPPERIRELHVVSILTRANDAAIVAYLVTGAFLLVLYYPHLWLQVGMGMALKRTMDNILLASEGQTVAALQPSSPRQAYGRAQRGDENASGMWIAVIIAMTILTLIILGRVGISGAAYR